MGTRPSAAGTRPWVVCLLVAMPLACRERPPVSQPPPPPAPSPAPAPNPASAAITSVAPAPADAPRRELEPTTLWDSAGALVLPRVLRDYCEGESCSRYYDERLLACAPLELRAADSAGAPVVARVAAGESLRALTGSVHVLEPGVVVFRRPWALAHAELVDFGPVPLTDTTHFTPADTVLVLEYRELGDWTWWHRGRFRASSEFWTGEGQAIHARGRDTLAAVSVRAPRREWWVRLRTDAGAEGWWKHDDFRAERQRVVNAEQGESCS